LSLAAVLCGLVFAPAPSPAQPFTQITGTGPQVQDQLKSLSAGWADFDGDGDTDLYVGHIGESALYRNDGLDTFVAVSGPPADTTADLANTAPAWGDYDNDGDLDLYRCIFTRDSLGAATVPLPNQLYRNDGGSFTPVTTSDDSTFCPAASWVDYDGDGDLDLFAAGAAGSPDLLYRNDGGSLTPHTGPAFLGTGVGGVTPGWLDYDADGDADLYMVNHGSPNELWRNLLVETGTPDLFEADTSSGLTDEGAVLDFAMSWGDYDNDGDLDGYLATFAADRLFRNEGDGTFTRILGIPPVQASGTSSCGAWGDYDNDGDVDLFVPHAPSSPTPPDVWRNDGGTFTAAQAGDVGDLLNSLPGPQNAEWADYDSDGDLDLYAVNWLGSGVGGTPRRNRLYRNDGTGNHWLHVELEGTASNRSGIGAAVHVHAVISGQPVRQLREVSGSPTAFEFQRELRAHFGLGDAATVDSVVVEWPSGLRQVVTSVSADQTLHVVEAAAVDASPSVQPLRTELRPPRPNPFGSSVTVAYSLARAATVEITVYDVSGRRVRTLLSGPRPAGQASLLWDGRDDAHTMVGPGVYFVRLRTPEAEVTRKALRVR